MVAAMISRLEDENEKIQLRLDQANNLSADHETKVEKLEAKVSQGLAKVEELQGSVKHFKTKANARSDEDEARVNKANQLIEQANTMVKEANKLRSDLKASYSQDITKAKHDAISQFNVWQTKDRQLAQDKSKPKREPFEIK